MMRTFVRPAHLPHLFDHSIVADAKSAPPIPDFSDTASVEIGRVEAVQNVLRLVVSSS
jgi:hypothetical protein